MVLKQMRLILLLFLLFFLAGSKEALASNINQEISIQMNGTVLSPDVSPVIRDGRTLVPFRTVAEALNLEVNWKAETQEIEVMGQGVSLKMSIGSQEARKNGSSVFLDVPPLILNGRTMVPIRFIGEAFGCQVQWIPQLQRVSISSAPATMEVAGYYALGDQTTSSWQDLFGTDFPQRSSGNTDIVKQLALGWYTMDQTGNLLTSSATGWQRPDGWKDVLTAALDYKLNTEMCIQMCDTNAKIRNLIRDEAARQLAIANIMTEVEQYNGVNLDFEGLGYKDTPDELSRVRADYTLFVNELARALHQSDKTITLSLHAPNSAYPGYDYAALGNLVDHIVIMAYDYGPKPEPADLVEAAIKTAAASVPAQKLYLGISAVNETEASLADKIGVSKRYRLGGIALWRLGLVSDGMWEIMRDSTR